MVINISKSAWKGWDVPGLW